MTGVGQSTLDVVICDARVVDGTGSPWFTADVGVVGSRIAAVGDLSRSVADKRIDAQGLLLAPGFIDSHVHSEAQLLREPVLRADLLQGITTHIVGQDGIGLAPTDESALEFMCRYLRPIYGALELGPATIGEFLARYDDASTVNVATLIPNGCVRHMVMGNSDRPAQPREIELMAELCRQGMREGAVGLSSGLDYVPSGYASTDELSALAAAVATSGGVYVTHIRYREGLLAAIREALEIGKRSGAPPHISHLMAEPDVGIDAHDVLDLLEAARRDGIDVTFDVYPYLFGCTVLIYLLPLFVVEGTADDIVARLRDPAARDRMRAELGDDVGRWRAIEIAGSLSPARESLLGCDVLTAAERCEQHPVDFVCDLLLEHDLDVLLLGVDPVDSRFERELLPMLAHALHMFGSDGVHVAGRAHPRTFGAAARYLRSMVRERGLLTLEDAVRHLTSFPARRYGLSDRGIIRPGFAADVVVFDEEAVTDHATRSIAAPAAGMQHVLVNGTLALEDGTPTGATPGRGLRREVRASESIRRR